MSPLEQWEQSRRSSAEFALRGIAAMMDGYADLCRCHIDAAGQICIVGARETFETVAKADVAEIVAALPTLIGKQRQRAERIGQDYARSIGEWQQQSAHSFGEWLAAGCAPLLAGARELKQAIGKATGEEPAPRRVVESVDHRMRKHAA